MVKNYEKPKQARPLLMQMKWGCLLFRPRGTEGEFDVETFGTNFRANDFISKNGIEQPKEIQCSELSQYMRLVPR
jgi:hypothetical protein